MKITWKLYRSLKCKTWGRCALVRRAQSLWLRPKPTSISKSSNLMLLTEVTSTYSVMSIWSWIVNLGTNSLISLSLRLRIISRSFQELFSLALTKIANYWPQFKVKVLNCMHSTNQQISHWIGLKELGSFTVHISKLCPINWVKMGRYKFILLILSLT